MWFIPSEWRNHFHLHLRLSCVAQTVAIEYLYGIMTGGGWIYLLKTLAFWLFMQKYPKRCRLLLIYVVFPFNVNITFLFNSSAKWLKSSFHSPRRWRRKRCWICILIMPRKTSSYIIVGYNIHMNNNMFLLAEDSEQRMRLHIHNSSHLSSLGLGDEKAFNKVASRLTTWRRQKRLDCLTELLSMTQPWKEFLIKIINLQITASIVM